MEDSDKDDNNFKDISALGLDRDLEFSREHLCSCVDLRKLMLSWGDSDRYTKSQVQCLLLAGLRLALSNPHNF